MATFADKRGDTHVIDLDLGMIEDVKKQTGIDLAEAMGKPETKLTEFLFGDPGQLVDMLYVVCEAERRGFAPDDWARRFNGAAIEAATRALMEGLIDFFPRQGPAGHLKKKLPAILQRVDQQMEHEIDQAFSKWLTGSPAPSASTPVA
jgi:hypothetical protein